LIESRVTRRFWKLFGGLPPEAQLEARRAYALFRINPAHPSLHFKKLQGEEHIYSARIGLGYRALGVLKGPAIVWYWIGAYSEYDRLS
jgi:hypothetical protein